jgi:hypothetical protein
VGVAVIIEDTSYTSLAGLRSLAAFPSRLAIERNSKLLDLTGLEALTGVGILKLNANHALASIEGLANMTGSASDIEITMNDALASLDGLGGIYGVTTNLTISRNASLRDLTGLDGLESVDGGITIQENPLLSTCEADELANRCAPSSRSISGNGPCP